MSPINGLYRHAVLRPQPCPTIRFSARGKGKNPDPPEPEDGPVSETELRFREAIAEIKDWMTAFASPRPPEEFLSDLELVVEVALFARDLPADYAPRLWEIMQNPDAFNEDPQDSPDEP